MATTYIQKGAVLTVPAPSGGVTVGTPFLSGDTVFIPQNTAAQTVSVDCYIGGVHSVTKADSQAWTLGQIVYWDDTAKNFTTTTATNKTAGIVAEAVASTAGLTTGKVLLNKIAG